MVSSFGGASLGTAVLTLTTDITGLQRGLARAHSSTTGTLDAIGRDARFAGLILAASISAPLIGIGALSIKAANDFETAFVGIQKASTGSEAQFESLRNNIRQMAKELPFSAKEIANIGEEAGRLGVHVDAMEQFIRTVLNLASATELSTKDAAVGLAQLATIFRSTPHEIDQLASAIAALGNEGAATATNILNMAARLSGAGQIIGLTAPEVLGLANGLASLRGISSELGGSTFSRLFVDIQTAVKGGTAALDDFAKVSGFTRDEFAKTFENAPADAIINFLAGLRRIQDEGGDVFAVLESLGLSTIRYRNVILQALPAVDKIAASIALGKKSYDENTAAAERAALVYDTNAAKLKIFRNVANDAAITLGGQLAPALTSIVQTLTPVVEQISNLILAFSALPPAIQIAALGFTGLLILAGPIMFFVSTWRAAIQALWREILHLNAAIHGQAAASRAQQAVAASAASTTSRLGGVGAAGAAGAANAASFTREASALEMKERASRAAASAAVVNARATKLEAEAAVFQPIRGARAFRNVQTGRFAAESTAQAATTTAANARRDALAAASTAGMANRVFAASELEVEKASGAVARQVALEANVLKTKTDASRLAAAAALANARASDLETGARLRQTPRGTVDPQTGRFTSRPAVAPEIAVAARKEATAATKASEQAAQRAAQAQKDLDRATLSGANASSLNATKSAAEASSLNLKARASQTAAVAAAANARATELEAKAAAFERRFRDTSTGKIADPAAVKSKADEAARARQEATTATNAANQASIAFNASTVKEAAAAAAATAPITREAEALRLKAEASKLAEVAALANARASRLEAESMAAGFRSTTGPSVFGAGGGAAVAPAAAVRARDQARQATAASEAAAQKAAQLEKQLALEATQRASASAGAGAAAGVGFLATASSFAIPILGTLALTVGSVAVGYLLMKKAADDAARSQERLNKVLQATTLAAKTPEKTLENQARAIQERITTDTIRRDALQQAPDLNREQKVDLDALNSGLRVHRAELDLTNRALGIRQIATHNTTDEIKKLIEAAEQELRTAKARRDVLSEDLRTGSGKQREGLAPAVREVSAANVQVGVVEGTLGVLREALGVAEELGPALANAGAEGASGVDLITEALGRASLEAVIAEHAVRIFMAAPEEKAGAVERAILDIGDAVEFALGVATEDAALRASIGYDNVQAHLDSLRGSIRNIPLDTLIAEKAMEIWSANSVDRIGIMASAIEDIKKRMVELLQVAGIEAQLREGSDFATYETQLKAVNERGRAPSTSEPKLTPAQRAAENYLEDRRKEMAEAVLKDLPGITGLRQELTRIGTSGVGNLERLQQQFATLDEFWLRQAIPALQQAGITAVDEVHTILNAVAQEVDRFREARKSKEVEAQVADLPGIEALQKKLGALNKEFPSTEKGVGNLERLKKAHSILDEYWQNVAVPKLTEAGIAVDDVTRDFFENLARTILDGKERLESSLSGLLALFVVRNVGLGRPSGVSVNSDFLGNNLGSPNYPRRAAASGFHGIVSEPTRFLIGESGPESVNITPIRDTSKISEDLHYNHMMDRSVANTATSINNKSQSIGAIHVGMFPDVAGWKKATDDAPRAVAIVRQAFSELE